MMSDRIAGLADEWQQMADGQLVSLIRASPGGYALQVRAENDEQGVKEITLHIAKEPAWYQTLLFKIAMVLLALSGLWAFFRYRVRIDRKSTRLNSSH